MILVAENLDTLGDKLMPSFAKGARAIDLGGDVPRRFAGGDVFVYSQRSNKTFAYVGVLRGAALSDRGELRFERYEVLSNPVVAYDEGHGIDRAELYAPNRGFGPHSFNYITEDAHAAIDAASKQAVERTLWQAVSRCTARCR